eukprot:scaffold149717_cov20-Tisochrysis_lutea.AAC.1
MGWKRNKAQLGYLLSMCHGVYLHLFVMLLPTFCTACDFSKYEVLNGPVPAGEAFASCAVKSLLEPPSHDILCAQEAASTQVPDTRSPPKASAQALLEEREPRVTLITQTLGQPLVGGSIVSKCHILHAVGTLSCCCTRQVLAPSDSLMEGCIDCPFLYSLGTPGICSVPTSGTTGYRLQMREGLQNV